MSRAVPEWRGKTDDSPIPLSVRLRILARQDYLCVGSCGSREFDEKLKPVFDHRPALINGGENRESKIEAICVVCHSRRTKLDVAAKALTNRIKAKKYGLRKPSKFQNARSGKWKTKINGLTVARTPD